MNQHTELDREMNLASDVTEDIQQRDHNPASLIEEQGLELLMLSCKRTEPKGDIRQFESIFQTWKNQEQQSEATEKDLKQKLELFEKEKEVSERKVKDLESTVNFLQNAIDSLHNDLELVDKLGKENADLKESVKDLQQKLAKARTESLQNCATYEHQINDNKMTFEKQIKELKDEMYAKLKEKDDIFNTMVTEKNEEIERLKKENESDIQKQMMEYENKLMKLQRQKVTASMNQQQNSSTNQEIFRKKLQHLKREHEAEINGMKEQIKKLQDQLSTSSSAKESSTAQRSSLSTHHSLFKKGRRF